MVNYLDLDGSTWLIIGKVMQEPAAPGPRCRQLGDLLEQSQERLPKRLGDATGWGAPVGFFSPFHHGLYWLILRSTMVSNGQKLAHVYN